MESNAFSAEIEKKNEIRIVIKRKYLFYQIRNIKPRYQVLIIRFNFNNPNQRYYLNGMWTRKISIDPVSMIPE